MLSKRSILYFLGVIAVALMSLTNAPQSAQKHAHGQLSRALTEGVAECIESDNAHSSAEDSHGFDDNLTSRRSVRRTSAQSAQDLQADFVNAFLRFIDISFTDETAQKRSLYIKTSFLIPITGCVLTLYRNHLF